MVIQILFDTLLMALTISCYNQEFHDEFDVKNSYDMSMYNYDHFNNLQFHKLFLFIFYTGITMKSG